jgi:endonuclease III related protein
MTGSKKARLEHIYRLLYKRFGKRNWWPADSPFEVIVGAILTQNTAWTNVEKAIVNLKRADMLSPGMLHDNTVSGVAQLIKPSGFYNQKAKRLKLMVDHLMTGYKGDIDELCKKDTKTLRDELLSIKGVGKETADSILLYACSKPVFVVDSYTYRVFYRHGLIDAQAGYDEIQDMFMDNLEHKAGLFNEYHALIVELAKNYCRTKPLCEQCPLSGLTRYI